MDNLDTSERLLKKPKNKNLLTPFKKELIPAMWKSSSYIAWLQRANAKFGVTGKYPKKHLIHYYWSTNFCVSNLKPPIKIPLFNWTQKGRRKPKKGIGKERCATFD
jgi:hypothetical protein